MSELRDRIRRALEREGSAPGRLELTLTRARRRERRRRVMSGAVGFAMFGAVVVAVWLGARGDRTPPGGEGTPVPSTITTPPAEEISPVARIACEEGRAVAGDDSVDALADGVHFSVENRTDGPVWFNDLDPLAPGRIDEFVLPLQPGDAEVDCRNDAGEAVSATVTVNDPQGYWIPPDLQCAEGEVSHADIAFGDDVGYDHPIGATLRIVPGVRDDDIVERAAYPETTDSAVVRVVRGGATVAAAEFVRHGDLWSAVSFELCGDESIGDTSTTPADQAPKVARVVCEEGRAEILDEEVAAQADGLHFVGESRRDELVLLWDRITLEPGESGGIIVADPPGRASAYCHPETEPEPVGDEFASLTITDPNGYWVDPELLCPPGGAIEDSTRDFADYSHGFQGTPEEAVRADREYKRRIEPGDLLIRGGYPEADG